MKDTHLVLAGRRHQKGFLWDQECTSEQCYHLCWGTHSVRKERRISRTCTSNIRSERKRISKYFTHQYSIPSVTCSNAAVETLQN